MGVLGGESREADGDVAGPRGRAIANALTGPRDDRLTGNHRRGLITVVDEEFPFQHDREFIEGGGLEGLIPSGRLTSNCVSCAASRPVVVASSPAPLGSG